MADHEHPFLDAPVKLAYVDIGGIEGVVAIGVLDGKIIAAAGEDPVEALDALFKVIAPGSHVEDGNPWGWRQPGGTH